MKYFIEINDEKYYIKKLSDLTIMEYNKIFTIIEDNDYVSLLYMLSDIPSEWMHYIPIEEITKIDWNNIINEPLNTPKIKKNYLGFDLLNLDEIKVGRYIDIDYYLTNEFDDKLQTLFALMLLPEEYTDKELKKLIEKINTLSISDISPVINYITSWRKNKLKQYESLFNMVEDEYSEDEDYEAEEEEEEVEEENDEYGWLGLCYEFAEKFYYVNNVNIFEADLTSFLNWLSWHKQKTEKEIEQQKKAMNKHSY